jgi:pyruvate/2-oxoacid:ferredoxin oxidoreductase beta subunit
VARTIDSDRKHLTSVLHGAAAEHRGTALVEIYQNCNIFNDDAFESAPVNGQPGSCGRSSSVPLVGLD